MSKSALLSVFVTIVVCVAALAASTGFAAAGQGAKPNENACHGQVISWIATTWPWPETHELFPPPKGSVALFSGAVLGGDRQAFDAYVDAACAGS
jgi:hypothetical protein